MADCKLFKISDENAIECKLGSMSFERKIQKIIENNMQTMFEVDFIRTEWEIQFDDGEKGRMDSIGIINTDSDFRPVIFEYKRRADENIINQGLYYLDWLLHHKEEFYQLVRKEKGDDYFKDTNGNMQSINWSSPRVYCIANDFKRYDLRAISQIDKDVQLIRYKTDSEGLLLLEFLNLNQSNSSKNKMNCRDSTCETTSDAFDCDRQELLGLKNSDNSQKVNKSQRMIERINNYPDSIMIIYKDICHYIEDVFDSVERREYCNYTAFYHVKKMISVVVQKNSVFVYPVIDVLSVSLSDNIEDVSGINGEPGKLRITIKSPEDFNDNVKQLIERAYNER